MRQKRFDGVCGNTEDVLQAALYSFPFILDRKRSGKYERTWEFQLFFAAYHAYHQGFVRENFSWIKGDYRHYRETRILPFYIMRFGYTLIKKAYEQEFIKQFRERYFGKELASEKNTQKEGRIFRGEIQKDGGSAELSRPALSSAQ